MSKRRIKSGMVRSKGYQETNACCWVCEVRILCGVSPGGGGGGGRLLMQDSLGS